MSAPPTTCPTQSLKHFLRILYADDLPELRDVARISFSRDGHGIECVEDGQLALNRVAADPGFDVVITDHHMPNMNGLDLVRQLRAIEYPGRIVVLSSELGVEVKTAYEQLRVDRILYKPVYPSALRGALTELFPGVSRAGVAVSRETDRPLRHPSAGRA